MRSLQVVRAAWRRSARLVRWPANRWPRSAWRVIAQARGAGLGGVAFGVQLHHTGVEDRVVLSALHPLGPAPHPTGSSPWLSATNTGSRLGMAGRPVRWRAASMACWQTASGLPADIPRPCRWKALRRDGQVVPSWAAAALTLPSRSASAKARSASKRLGCQPCPAASARHHRWLPRAVLAR